MSPAAADLGRALALAEGIRTLGSVPSGHLFAQVCGHLTIAEYERYIGALERVGLITVEAHLITWIGPKVTD